MYYSIPITCSLLGAVSLAIKRKRNLKNTFALKKMRVGADFETGRCLRLE